VLLVLLVLLLLLLLFGAVWCWISRVVVPARVDA
jgi:hypothetical protein